MPIERFQAPNAGEAIQSNGRNLDKAQARRLQNVRVDVPGRIDTRGPFSPALEVTNNGLPSTDKSPGVWRFGSSFRIELDDATVIGANLGVAGLTSTAGGAVAATENCRDYSVRVGDYAYACPTTIGSTSASKLLRWTGVTADAPVQLTNAPYGAGCIAAHLSRVFVGGGTVPGTTTPRQVATIYWTDPTASTSLPDTVAAWSDADSNINSAQIGTPGDPIIAMASLGRQLIIVKRTSVYTLLGDTPSTFTVRRISNTRGANYSTAMLTLDDSTVIFGDTDGNLSVFDGTSFSTIMGPVPAGGGGGVQSIALLPNDYLLCTMTSIVEDTRVWLLHLPSRSWIRVIADPNIAATLKLVTHFVVSNENGSTLIIGDEYARLADGLTARKYDKQNTLSVALNAPGRELQDTTSTYNKIPARWDTRIARLALPGSSARIRRATLDYFAEYIFTETSPVLRWRIELYDARDRLLATADAASSSQSSSSPNVRSVRSVTFDVYAETQDLWASIYMAADPGNPSAEPGQIDAELYDLWVEYEPAQQPNATF